MIPKPSNLKTAYYSLSKLRAIYQWPEGRFEAFRRAVHLAKKQYLDNNKKPGMQDIEKWEKFKLQVVTKFPELEEFEDYWPVYALLECQRRIDEANKNKKTPRKPRRHNVRLPSLFVRKASSSLRVQSETGKMTVTSTASRPLAEYDKKVAPQVFLRPSFSSITQPGPSHMQARVSELRIGRDTGQIARQFQTHNAIDNSLREQPTIEIGCVVCLFCDFIPDIPASAKTHIQMFSQNKTIIDTLTQLGIVNDKHLSIFNLLITWNAGPKDFIESLAKGMLSPLYKSSLLQHFQKYFSSKGPASSYRNINCWSGCPDHSRGNDDKAPPKLQRLLEVMSMEELVPLFIAAHVKTDDDFDLLHDLDEAQRLAIFDIDQLRNVRPFQRWMLNFLLAHIHMLDYRDDY